MDVVETFSLGELHDVLQLAAGRGMQRAWDGGQPPAECFCLGGVQVVQRPRVAANDEHQPARRGDRVAVLESPVVVEIDAGSDRQLDLSA